MHSRRFSLPFGTANSRWGARWLLLFVALVPMVARAGVVSTCDEASLRAALNGGGAVTFGCSGTITVAATLTISTNTSIDGSGQTVTISGGNSVQVLNVGSGVTLNLNRVTIANGKAFIGGAIENGGILTIANSTFSGNLSTNSAGAIENAGTATIINSTFSGNSASAAGGGAIRNDGTLIVANSTFSGNSAGTGGGIFNDKTLTVTNSTFSGNTASVGDGGIDNSDGNGGTATLANTILANNTHGDCANTGLTGNSFTDGGYNLDDDGTCGFTSANHSLSNDKNAGLGSLSSNGGPTQTIPLQSGSDAIGVIPPGTNGCAATIAIDQRGVARPGSVNGNCSMGAYEYVPSADSTITDCTSDTQLQAAVINGGRIVFTCSGTITLTRALGIGKNTTIDGTGQSVTISGGGNVQAILSNQVLTLNELTIANGSADTSLTAGGGIFNLNASLTVTNSTFSGNSAYAGGGIFTDRGTVTVTNSKFSGNSASASGGGIFNDAGTVTVTNSTFSGNSAGSGGGMWSGGTLAMTNSTFSGNSALAAGGFGNSETAVLKNTILVNNTGGNCPGGGFDGGYNLDDDGSCGFSSTNHSFSNNQNANLGSLSNNGGPTQTIPLQYPSYAIDAIPLLANGCGSGIFTDQRGVFRAQGPACDMGAYEANQIPIAFNTNRGNLSYTVGPSTDNTPQAPFLVVGGQYTISTTSPQAGATGTQYVWQSWSDGGTQSHQITVSPLTTSYTANFQTQYLLTTGVNPNGAGTATPPSGSYYPAGSQVTLTAAPNSGYAFTGWTGTITSSSNPLNVTLSGPMTETANFVLKTFTITPNPPSETVYRGHIAVFVLTLKSVNGFNGNVKLSCSGGPAGSYCVNFPMTVRLNGTAYAASGIFFPNKASAGTYVVTFSGVSGLLSNTATAKFTVK